MYEPNSVKRLFTTFLICFASAIAIISCSSSSSDDDDEVTPTSYSGPGSKWDVTLDGTSFTITRREDIDAAVDMTVEGTYTTLASGFLKLTVASATGTDAPTAGDEAWALNVPGYIFLLRPLDEDSDQVIPMVSGGACPTEDIEANWVLVKKSASADATATDRDFFGEFEFDVATGQANLPQRRALDDNYTNQGAQALTAGTCGSGIMEVDDAVMYLTTSGGAIVHTSVDDEDEASFIFGFAQKAITNVTGLDGDYAGVLFDGSNASGDQIVPIAFSCTSGTCIGNMVTDIDNNTLSADSVTVTLSGTVDDYADGLITGEIDSEGQTGNIACMADINAVSTGKKVINCAGQSPGDNTDLFNILLVSKD